MIELSIKDKTQIFLKVKTTDPVRNWTVTFVHTDPSEFDTLLTKDNIEKSLKEFMRNEREKYYKMGFKDARAKVRKQIWFPGWFQI